MNKAAVLVQAEETFFWTWALKVNCLSSQISSHLSWLTDFMTVLFESVIYAVCSFLPLQKWINLDLLSLNCTAFSSAHANTVLVTSCNSFEFSFADFSHVYSVTSSIELDFCTWKKFALIFENKNLM